MRMLIKGGRVIDPGVMDEEADILINQGRIEEVRTAVQQEGPDEGKDRAAEKDLSETAVIDARGLLLVPGLIDMHVHLREPGQEYKETIKTGLMAAAAGGFTAVCCMPNTYPVNDSASVTGYITEQAARCSGVHVYPVGAISVGLCGEQLAEYGELKAAGAVGVSDDGKPVADAQLMRRALEYAGGIGLKVISHCEELALSAGVINEGAVSTRLGLAGIPNAAESVMVMRDIALSELTGTPVHIAHVSTRESVEAIRAAKARGTLVTAETAPHYFTLTDEAVNSYDTRAKMNPPLRTEKDRLAVAEALADGTIEAIASDHAPHSRLEKEVEFDLAANGIIGLETSFALGLRLAEKGVLSLERLIAAMSKNPAKIIGKPCGIAPGLPADITIIDLSAKYKYSADKGRSKSRNSPFDGWNLKGRAVYTIAAGQLVFDLSQEE
ncbi:MAG: dihydroorotase [Desulfobacteraceae bacterium]|nr:dihydroorotase [Desulfobacteraceae bacterium]